MQKSRAEDAGQERSDSLVDLRYGNAPQRRNLVRDSVRSRGFCSSAELSETLLVSEMTIRRDIQVLAAAGELLAVHGGAAAVPEIPGTTIRARSAQRPMHKAAIGREAAKLIHPDSVVGLDSGTTALAVASAACQSPNRPLVLSNSLPVLQQYATVADAHVVSLGGVLNAELGLLVLNELSQTAGRMRLDQYFLATSAVRNGALYCGTSGDARTKTALLAIADSVVLVADSSKFVSANRAMTYVTDLDSVSTVVTDWEIADADVAQLEALGIRVIVAQASQTRRLDAQT